jgi:PAS domain S-box-containing protein
MNDSTNPVSDEVLNGQLSCRQLMDISPDPMLVHFQNRIVGANDHCLRLVGATQPDQLVGLPLVDLFPADVQPSILRQSDGVISRRQPVPPDDITIRRLDGRLERVRMHSLPIPRPDGGVTVLVVLREAIERDPSRGKAPHGEIAVRSIIDTAMDGIISMNEEQKIVLFNAAAESIFGWRADQVTGRSIDKLIPGRFHQQHQRDVGEFGRGTIEHRRMGAQRTVLALRATGEEFPIEASISRTVVDGGMIYTAIVRDVSESVRHRRQIEQQSQMLDQVSDAVTMVDMDGRITFWNQAASRLYGWPADEVLGRRADEILYRGDPGTLRTMLQETNERRSWVCELTKISRSGKTVIVEHRRTVVRDGEGIPTGHLCIDIDISDRKKRERVSNRSQRLEMIGTLAGGIAHDLNNILTPILMGTQLLATGRAPDDHRALLQTMQASAQRGADLIKKLLSFAGGIRGGRSPVRMEQLVAETRGLLEHTLPPSIRFETRVDAGCPPALGDATELAQILLNLCINARDAMPDGGTLTVEVSFLSLNGTSTQMDPNAHPGLYVVLKVSDTGCGMTPEILDRIFDPFFTTKEIGKGTGLGLATVQGIVKSHGGFVTVYSEAGNGSKFSVFLPADAKSEVAAGGTIHPQDDPGEGRTVLLVDDEASVLKMTSIALEDHGYRVITAEDGEAAIALFLRHHLEISIVLLDLMMPGMDGLHTIDQLRRIDPAVSIIACSGLRTSQREAEVLERGAKGFLPKPYSEEELLQTIDGVLKSSR